EVLSVSPPLALALTVLLMGYLLRRDSRQEPRVSSGVWIPILWLLINGSRQASQWLNYSGTDLWFSAQALEDGNPVDKAAYGTLILAGILVLATRRLRFGEIIRNNRAIVLFLLYEGLSAAWSDFPLVSFKRWGKGLGDAVMVLVLWTDAYPERAVAAAI